MKRRGALELSVNTIVIIVIGVALLTLGLMFVRNIFGGITKISDNMFIGGETEIRKIHQEAKFTVPLNIDVKRGSEILADVYVGNDGVKCGNQPARFSLVLTKVGNFDENEIRARVVSNPVPLAPGEEGKFSIKIVATKDAPLQGETVEGPTYQVVAKCGNIEYDSSAFIINVQKGGGLFD